MDDVSMFYADDVTMFWVKVLLAMIGLRTVGQAGDWLLTKKGGGRW